MNYFTGKPLDTVGHVIAATVDSGQLDCEDTARVHAWVVCPAWSVRRAFIVDGEPFVRAALGAPTRGPAASTDYLDALLSDERYAQSLRTAVEHHVVGMHFYIELVGPTDEAEPGERIEIRSVRCTPPLEEVERRLGIR